MLKIALRSKLAQARLTLIALVFLMVGYAFTVTTTYAANQPATGTKSFIPQVINQSAGRLIKDNFANFLNLSPVNEALGLDQNLTSSLRLGQNNVTPPRWSGTWANFGMASSLPVQLAAPFNSLKAEWLAEVPAGTKIEVDVRASQNRQTWTLWEVLTENGATAQFDSDRAYLYSQYRIRMFTADASQTPVFSGVTLTANRLNVDNLKPLDVQAAAAPAAPPPTFKVYGTREGLVGGRTANGHIITERDHFVSLPSWKALNDLGKYDYQVKIVAPNGKSATAPVWDSGPWNFSDNYWHNPRDEFKDLPVGVPQAEKAYFENHNGGLNESGRRIYNPSGIDIGDGTYWDDLGLAGASTGGKLDVTFLWEGAIPGPATINGLTAVNIGSGTATINWTTASPTTDWVEYGFDGQFQFRTPVYNGLTATHSVNLKDLAPNRTYSYRVKGKDVYGTETSSPSLTFKTSPGLATLLSAWQNDPGIGVTIAADNDSVKVAGGRVNKSYWSDNPTDDYSSGASTIDGNVGTVGGLDVDFEPVCDDKGQNCAFGTGTGYKTYVQFQNKAGQQIAVGLIHDSVLSPNNVTIMVEGTNKSSDVQRYSAPDLLDQTKAHHFHFVWQNGQLYPTVDFTIKLDPIAFGGEGVKVVFAGAARYKDDVVAVNFNNIGFSWGSVVPAPPAKADN